MASELKKKIRKGTPLKEMRRVILKIFDKTDTNFELTYNSTKNAVFKGTVPTSFRNVPTFATKNFEELVALPCLNR